MASQYGIRILRDWAKDVHTGLRRALVVSQDIMSRTGEEATRHAIILMAQSARAMTKIAPARRKVLRDPNLGMAKYVEIYKRGKPGPIKLYAWKFGPHANPRDRMKGTFEQARKIARRGLAKTAWMWGLSKIGGPPAAMGVGKVLEMRGIGKLYPIRRENVAGWIKENRLSYILKALPAGWRAIVESRVVNKIMMQAVRKMQREWRRNLRGQAA